MNETSRGAVGPPGGGPAGSGAPTVGKGDPPIGGFLSEIPRYGNYLYLYSPFLGSYICQNGKSSLASGTQKKQEHHRH